MYDVKSQMSDALVIYVGRRLKSRRLSLKLTQQELGNKLDISSQQVQKYESGANVVNLRMLEKISNVLGVPIEYFIKGYTQDDCIIRDENKIVFEDDILEKESALLSKYFKKINDDDVRKKILNLVKSLSCSVSKQKGKK